MTVVWVAKHPKATPDMLGYIPSFVSDDDPRSAKEQLDSNYQHGGGWRKFEGHVMQPDSLKYPGDPPMPLLYEARLRNERIRFYLYSWVAIVQEDGTYEIARMD